MVPYRLNRGKNRTINLQKSLMMLKLTHGTCRQNLQTSKISPFLIGVLRNNTSRVGTIFIDFKSKKMMSYTRQPTWGKLSLKLEIGISESIWSILNFQKHQKYEFLPHVSIERYRVETYATS